MAAWQDFWLSDWGGGGAPPVTGTATFTQAAATWEATLSERIAATATFAQTASWDATATERLTATAEWVQEPATWAADSLVANPVTGTATFTQEPAAWAAEGQEAFEATASFLQAPAAWAATTTESFTAVGEWIQDAASWQASQSQDVTATGTFEQSQAWEAVASSAEDILADATWQQTQSWAASAAQAGATSVPAEAARHGPSIRAARVIGPAVRRRRRIAATASFSQPVPAWTASIHVSDDLALLLLLEAS